MRPVLKVDNFTTPPCADVMKSRNLNLLEPSGSLQACNGTDLLFFSGLILSQIGKAGILEQRMYEVLVDSGIFLVQDRIFFSSASSQYSLTFCTISFIVSTQK